MRLHLLGLIALTSLQTALPAFAQTPNPPDQTFRPPPASRPLAPRVGEPRDPQAVEKALAEPGLLAAAELAAAFGLKGRLATDCSIEPSKPGNVLFNPQADGSLVSESIDPDGSRVRTIMFKGKKLDDKRVEFLGYATYNGPPIKRLVWQTDGEKFQFVSSQTLDGMWLIRDSRLGNRVWQWVTPCRSS